jgi:hypothetical protein
MLRNFEYNINWAIKEYAHDIVGHLYQGPKEQKKTRKHFNQLTTIHIITAIR